MADSQITLAAGCFWCVEAVYLRVAGVRHVESGYANGDPDHPTYQQICTGTTRHAEVIQITFDPARVNLASLLEVFWTIHDPTTLNRQGNDTGTQYRSGIYYTDDSQQQLAEASKAAAQGRFTKPIVTEIEPLRKYFPAEDYHQDYFTQNPGNGYCQLVIPPKLAKLEKLHLPPPD